MYYKYLFTTIAALALASTAAFADGPSVSVTELPITATSGQTGFVGGSVGLEYGRSTQKQNNESTELDLDHRSQSVSLEYAATPKLAFAVDLENQSMSFGSVRAEGAVATLHGIYTLNRNVKIGAWVTRDKTLANLKIDGINIGFPNTYGKGVEVAYKTGALEVQGFWGTLGIENPDGPDFAATQTGISADYSFDRGFSLVAGMDRMSNEYGVQRNQFFGGEYEMANGAVLYAQRATTSFSDSNDITSTTTFFGVRFDFGQNSGTTFRLRDMQDLVYFSD